MMKLHQAWWNLFSLGTCLFQWSLGLLILLSLNG